MVFSSLHFTPYFSTLLFLPPVLVCYWYLNQMAPSFQLLGCGHWLLACLGSAPLLVSITAWTYRKDQFCSSNPPTRWHLAVCGGTACSIRSVIFSNLNYWNGNFLHLKPGQVLFFAWLKSSLCQTSILCFKIPSHNRISKKKIYTNCTPLMNKPVFFSVFC